MKPTDWQADKQWSDGFVDQVRAILAANALHIVRVEIASMEDDAHKATDMLITVNRGQVAVRIRRDSCRHRDLTLRSWRASGTKTELAKIREGFGDFYLYGWSSNNHIAEWILVDLTKLRTSGLLDNPREKQNPDGKTGFAFIPAVSLQEHDCILASHFETPLRKQLAFIGMGLNGGNWSI